MMELSYVYYQAVAALALDDGNGTSSTSGVAYASIAAGGSALAGVITAAAAMQL
jgi:hypothetical protein